MALISLVALFVTSVVLVLPLRWINPATTAFMIADERDLDEIRFEWVAWNDISESLALAAIAAEDQRFFDHAGIDFASIKKSVEDARRRGAGLRGASTITQQVAKNLYLWRGRSFVRKGIEAYLALLIDLTWPKQRILEVYLNIAEFGPGIYGVGAASDIFFGKSARTVSDAEAARLAAVLPNPIRLNAG
ncbi:MAG: monofunctional biosynthetic peptidoglycan transglycosylase, partial [Woeseiaceae bacterium]|nr:monofunctional biosynthetic peptidoglycan transglycosylase [Woeseiaceae bacterium]